VGVQPRFAGAWGAQQSHVPLVDQQPDLIVPGREVVANHRFDGGFTSESYAHHIESGLLQLWQWERGKAPEVLVVIPE
jgi:hypothetical protein